MHPIYMRRNTGIPTYGLRQSILINKRLRDCYVDASTLTNIWTSKTYANPNGASKGGPTSSWEVVKNSPVSSPFSLVKLVLRRQPKDRRCPTPPKLGGEGKARKISKTKMKGTSTEEASLGHGNRDSVPNENKNSGKLSGTLDLMGPTENSEVEDRFLYTSTRAQAHRLANKKESGTKGPYRDLCLRRDGLYHGSHLSTETYGMPKTQSKQSQKEEKGAVSEDRQDGAVTQTPVGENKGSAGKTQGPPAGNRSERCPQDTLIIHGLSAQQYTALYHSVVEPMLWNTSGTPKRYSLELGKVIKQRLWEALCRQATGPSEVGCGGLQNDPNTPGKRTGPKMESDVSVQPAAPKWPRLE